MHIFNHIQIPTLTSHPSTISNKLKLIDTIIALVMITIQGHLDIVKHIPDYLLWVHAV